MSDLKPCPHCGESLVEHTDHHGSWWSHRNEPCDCAHGVTQLFDADDFEQWNRRADATAISERDRRVEKLEAEYQEFRLQNDREWRAKLDSVKAQLTASRAECEGLRAALESIISSETDYANATVKRIVRIARAALSQKETGA